MSELVTWSQSSIIGIHHFVHYKGDSFDYTLTFQHDTNGDQIFVDDDISLDSFRMHVRCPKTGKLVLPFLIGKGLTIVNNRLVMLKTAFQMNSVEGGIYTYDMEQIFISTGKTRTRFGGNFIINSDSTY